MFGLGFGELALILVIAFIVLGPKRLPEMARGLGKALRELRKASADIRSTFEEPLEDIRKPLEDMRNDLVETVHHVKCQMATESAIPDGINSTPSVEGEPISTDDLNENEARLKQIEAVYAAAEREDINEISQPVLPDAEHGPPVSTPPHDH